MKKGFLVCLICVFFVILSTSVGVTFACNTEHLEFVYQDRFFDYFLEPNLKHSSVFDSSFEINKYQRFFSKEKRIELLNKMLSLGFDKEICLEYLFPNLAKTLNLIEKNISMPPKDAKLKINSNSNQVFHILTEQVGINVDKSALLNNIISNYINNKSLTFNVPIIKTNPKVTAKDIKKISNLRSDFSTNIASSSADRKHNIKNALNSINKFQLEPNQVFSFNKVVGKRTMENGYRQAKIIVNNEYVDGLGGGVCQVSSTLYNSALLAGLEILEANKHSKQVGYVNQGFDAMVNFGSSDLKFKNNTNETLTIITNYSPSKIRIRIFGEVLENTFYKLSNKIINITEPIEEYKSDINNEYLDKVKYEDEFFCLKKGTRGMEVESYREKYVNNILVEKTLLRRDKFKADNTIIIYGNQKRENLKEKSTELFCA